MPKPVIIRLKSPIFGGGTLTDREVMREKVFTEELHGKEYRNVAKQWATTHVNNVGDIEGLDKESEEAVMSSRK